MPRDRGRKSTTRGEDGSDKTRSMEDWKKLNMETLKLKCNQYSLVSTGKKADIQVRLYDHFHQQQEIINNDTENIAETRSSPVAGRSANNADSNNVILNELLALRSEIDIMKATQN